MAEAHGRARGGGKAARPRRGARRVCTWAAGCSCRLVLPPVISKIICHLYAGLDVGRLLRKSPPWRGIALSQPGVGLAARGASSRTASPPPLSAGVRTFAPPPRSRAQLIAVSTLVLLGRLSMETQTKSSLKHKVRKSHKQANKKRLLSF